MSWTDNFPALSNLTEEDRAYLLQHGVIQSVTKDKLLFGPRLIPASIFFVLKGSIRVQQGSKNGREIVLFRSHQGECCVLATNCPLAPEDSTVHGIAESKLQVAALPQDDFEVLMSRSAGFRHFLFHTYSKRMISLFNMVDDVAFQRVDKRLANKLIELTGNQQELNITHRQLAAEIGTAREVVSRQLSEFQQRSWIGQSRGIIRIQDNDSLTELAKSS